MITAPSRASPRIVVGGCPGPCRAGRRTWREPLRRRVHGSSCHQVRWHWDGDGELEIGVDASFVRDVARFFGVAHAIPVGGGTSGLYLALRAIGVARRRVIIPAFTCPTVAVAVVAAGGQPLLVDVSLDDCNLSVGAVAGALDDSVAAIISVDSFGYAARNASLQELATQHGSVLIEDACQSYGGITDDVPLGGQADIGVISFGTHKSVELRSGGFLLTNDCDVARRIRHHMCAPDFAALECLRERVYRRASLSFDHIGRLRMLCSYTGLLRYRFPERRTQRAPGVWKTFVDELPETKATLHRVREELESWPLITTFKYEGVGWLPWHYSFTIPDDTVANRFASLAAECDLPCGRNYRAMDEYFPGLDTAGSLPNSHWIAAHIYNLPNRTSLESTRELLPKVRALRREMGRLARD